MSKTILFLLCSSILCYCVSSESQPLKLAVLDPIFEKQCCYQHKIFSLDRTWWMNQAYPFLGHPTGFPVSGSSTFMGHTAYSFNELRQYQDIYMGVHQFTCATFDETLMDHKVPRYYPGIYHPQINTLCDLTTDLNVPLNHFIDELNAHQDHTSLNLIFPASSFVIFPSYETIQNLINAVNRIKCGVTLNLYVVEWWKFKNSRRNLQAVSPQDDSNTKKFGDVLLQLGQDGGRLPQFEGLSQPEYDSFKLALQNGLIKYNEYNIGSESEFQQAFRVLLIGALNR